MNKVKISKKDFADNIDKIKKFVCLNDENIEVIAVVKGNAYGFDLIQSAKFLEKNGISFFAVASVSEAVLLRESGIKSQIMMLVPVSDITELKLLIKNNIILTISSKEDILLVEGIKKKVNVHVKIDTGFGRYGFIYNEMENLVKLLNSTKYININGIFSHFASSYYDKKYTDMQYARFMESVNELKRSNINVGLIHISNSSAVFNCPEYHLNAVRVGSLFTGRLSVKNILGLKKVGYVESTVSEIKVLPKGFCVGYSSIFKTKKETSVAIIPCGYSNGYKVGTFREMYRFIDKLRYIFNGCKDLFRDMNSYVKINGVKCKILGMSGMNHVVCDVTDKCINIGDIVVFDINPKYVDSSVERKYI